MGPIGAERFILGVGAQKCGTTWLHGYLSGHPQVQMPALKELHYFDLVLRPDIFRIDIAGKLAQDIPGPRRRGPVFDFRILQHRRERGVHGLLGIRQQFPGAIFCRITDPGRKSAMDPASRRQLFQGPWTAFVHGF